MARLLILSILLLVDFPTFAEPVVFGIDVLLDKRIDLVKGKRIGLVTNASAVDGKLESTLMRLYKDKRVKLVQIYTPEHGIHAALANGMTDKNGVDPDTGIPVEGIWGKNRRPSKESLRRVDILVFDIQDIGSRTYTYISTLGEVMIAASKARIPLIVLDRPNPRGGISVEGPIREDRYKSVIGFGPLPVTHGMTIGEIALFYNGELKIGCDLTVVKMEGWKRAMIWEDTGHIWVPTSPGIPHTLNMHLYVATGMVGGAGVNVNEGGGNSMPFELIGAPFIKSREFAQALNQAKLEGIIFRPFIYRPARGQFAGKVTPGVQLILTEPRVFRPLRCALTILVTLRKLYGDKMKVTDPKRFARVWGNDKVLRMIMEGKGVEEIESSWAKDLETFKQKRAKYLLYD